MIGQRSPWALWGIFFGLALALVCPSGCRQPAQEKKDASPEVIRLPSIIEATEPNLQVAQAKLTYGGEQLKPIATIVFYTSDRYRSMSAFVPFMSLEHRFSYGNDFLPEEADGYGVRYCSIRPSELFRIAQGVHPILQRIREEDKGPWVLSFALLRHQGNTTTGFDYHIPRAEAGAVYRAVYDGIDPKREIARKAVCDQCTCVSPETRIPGCP